MYMGRFLILSGLCLLYLASHAATMKPDQRPTSKKLYYPAQRMSLRGVKEIRVVGVKGRVNVLGTKSSYLKLQVRHSAGKKFEDWQLSVDRRDDILYFEVFSLIYGREWRQHVRQDAWPEFDIDLEGPSRPTIVSWREGQLSFQDWNSPIDISFSRGDLRIHGGGGAVKVHPIEADVEVVSRRGEVKIQGQVGNVELRSVVGGIHLDWLSGKILLHKCEGKIEVESMAANVEVIGGKGDLLMKVANGRGVISQFSGMIKASGNETRWRVSARAPSDLNVTSSTGPVDVAWTGGGARVFLTTNNGKVNALPNYLRSTEHEGVQVFAGRKQGSMRGDVFVRTQSGAISWQERQGQ